MAAKKLQYGIDMETFVRRPDRLRVNAKGDVVNKQFYFDGKTITLYDKDDTLPTCAYLSGEYGITDVYMSVPARLGRAGVLEVVELPVNAEELAALQASAATIAEAVDSLGLRG